MISTNLYIKTILKQKFPSLDVTDGSPLSELFLNPTSAILDPVLTQLKYILDNLGLQDPEGIDPAELDAIAGNFLVYRRQAIPAKGYVELFYDTIQAVTIPVNTVFISTDGRQYVNTVAMQISAARLQANTWRYPLYSTGLIPVSSISDTSGAMLQPGMITDTTLVPAPTLVTNPTTFTVGVVAETNTELVERLVDSVVNRSLASEESFNVLISENFPSVVQTTVIGAGDYRMIRDTYYSGQESLQDYHESDFIGKVNTGDFIKGNVPNTDQYPYSQSVASWQLFYDNPTSSGIIHDMPLPGTVGGGSTFWREFTTSQYSNLYYRNDNLGTDLNTTLILDDTLKGTPPAKLNPIWLLGDAHFGTNALQDSNEITLTINGTQFGYIPGAPDENALIPVTRSFLTTTEQALTDAIGGSYNSAANVPIIQEINTLLAAPAVQNYFPILHTPLEYNSGISITGKFTTTDTSNTQLSYVTVLRNHDTLSPFDGLGFAWKTGPSNEYNVYLVDRDQLDETIPLTSGELFQSLSANHFKTAVLGAINSNTQYSFELDIDSNFALELYIWPTADGNLDLSDPNLITTSCSAFNPASITSGNVTVSNADFGIAVAGTNGQTWTYSDIQISSTNAVHTIAWFQLKADHVALFPESSTVTINCYGYGISDDTVTKELDMYIWNLNTNTWELLGSNTATNITPLDLRRIYSQFQISSTYRDVNDFINIALTTPRSI